MVGIGIIGAGTVGTALAFRLAQAGYPIVAVMSRTRASAERLVATLGESGTRSRVYDAPQSVADDAEVVFVTTPDDAIGTVVASVRWHAGQSVVHCSGADSLGPLEPARRAGASVGGFHPLQTFASVQQAIENLPGSTFALEAEEPLLGTLAGFARSLEGRVVRLGPGDKVLYHAAAVIACNYAVTLMNMATDLWAHFGVSKKDAIDGLMPLLRGTLNNLANVGLPNALTGPIARGDIGTIRKHLEALEARAPGLLPAYRAMGLQTIPVALGKGRIGENRAAELRTLLESADITREPLPGRTRP